MQIVAYESAPDAALVVADGDAVERVALEPGRVLAYGLGERHCAGVVDGERHEPCATATAPWCAVHADRWHEGMIADREDEHVVYLAVFAPATFKVGVTRTWRLETRLREQGADRGAHVATVADGRAARELESEIGAAVGERVRVSTKIAGLHRDVDDAAWAALLDGFDVHETFAFDYGFDLDEQPVAETLASGTVLGVQGRVLVLETDATRYAVDLRDLVGHDLVEGGEARDRQSSLRSFD